jgi:hypothetical protein
MEKIFLLTLAVVLLLGASCAGNDHIDKDTIPPINPTLIPHLGDTGDPPTTHLGQPIIINDENNGIDTVPDGDWIRVVWDPFKDTDLSHLKIYRFDEFNTDPVQIDSLSASTLHFLDTDSQLTERVWYSYFIDLVDSSGNTSRSDTVSYALLSKSILLTPENNDTVSPDPLTGVKFTWDNSGFASMYRLVIFDELSNYVWHQDLVVSFDTELLEIKLPTNLANEYSGQSLRWRIDSFDWDETMQKYMGSESEERIVHIQ